MNTFRVGVNEKRIHTFAENSGMLVEIEGKKIRRKDTYPSYPPYCST